MATEKRLISLDEAIAKIKDEGLLGSGYSDDERVDDVIDMLESCHIVDAVEVVHGHWTATDVIIHKAGYGVRYYYHAECKVNPHRLFECENDYCPNCGAKMDGDGNGC